MSRARIDSAGEQAIDWLVRLRAGAPDESLRSQFEIWLAADINHAQAWERLQKRVGTPYQTLRALESRLPGQAAEAREILLVPFGRRDLLRGLVGIGVLGGGVWLGARGQPGQALLADFHTATGERRTIELADGSRLDLNARSAVDVVFEADRRLLRLRQGELVIEVAADPQRPFIVRTAEGDARALGTRFLVSQQRDSTRVVVLEHAVRASLRNGDARELREGGSALLHQTNIEMLADDERHRSDWLRGRLSVLDQPLAEVVDALRPYRRGLIRVAPEIRDLRVQGVYPLDDTERALTALAETLPIRIDRYGPWLTLLGPRT